MLHRLRATPLSPMLLLLAHLLVSLVATVSATMLLLVVGWLGYDLPAPRAPLAAAVGVLVGAASAILVSLLLVALPLSTRQTEAVAFVTIFPMLFLSGAAFNREDLPELAQRVGAVLPLTYLVDALRRAWVGAGWDWAALAVLVGSGVTSLLVTVRYFRWE